MWTGRTFDTLGGGKHICTQREDSEGQLSRQLPASLHMASLLLGLGTLIFDVSYLVLNL